MGGCGVGVVGCRMCVGACVVGCVGCGTNSSCDTSMDMSPSVSPENRPDSTRSPSVMRISSTLTLVSGTAMHVARHSAAVSHAVLHMMDASSPPNPLEISSIL